MYIIMEVQIFADGGISTPCYAYSDKNRAEQKYHTILASAAVSKLPRHTCLMLMDDGRVIRSESYEHPIEPEPEPEPTPDPEPEESEGE